MAEDALSKIIQIPTKPHKPVHQGTPTTPPSDSPPPIPFPTKMQRNQRAEDRINNVLEQESAASYFRPIFEPFFNGDSSSAEIIDTLKADGVLPQDTPTDAMTLQIADEYLQQHLALALNAFRENSLTGADIYVSPHLSGNRSKKTVELSSNQDESIRKMIFSVTTQPDGKFNRVLGISFHTIHSY